MRDVIFKNGLFLSPNDVEMAPSVCEAILVKNGHIAAIGNLSDLEKQADTDVLVVDLNGKTLMPAFNDAHIHIWKVGDLLTFMLDLRGVKSLAAMQTKIADFAEKNPQNAWILARGFNENHFSDGQMPTRFDLDEVVSDRPCYVIRTCAHVAVLNSKALEVCGINDKTAVPNGGEIKRFRISDFEFRQETARNSKSETRNTEGVLSGVLTETALGLVQKFLPKQSPNALKIMVLAAQNALLKCGIAAATDPAVMPDLLAVYKEMAANNELKIRINAIPIVVPDGATDALPLPDLYESDFLKINTVKFFADGGLSGKTAALKGFYKNSTERGVLRLHYDFFKPLAEKAQAAGFKIATHAIGDEAIDEVLSVYEDIAKNNHEKLTHRIEHLAFPSAKNLTLMQKLGVHCVTQPIFLYELGPNFRQYLTPQYLDRVYPYRTVFESKVNLAFSSDAPVVKDFSPLMGIQNAVQRIDFQGYTIAENERIDVATALMAYTLNAAKANDDAAIMGSLTVGKRADFVVLDENPLGFQRSDLASWRETDQQPTADIQHQNTEGGKISDIRVDSVWVMGVCQLENDIV